MKTIPALVNEYDDQTVMEVALIENLQREDLNPIEEALGYKDLMDRFSLTQEQREAFGSNFAEKLKSLITGDFSLDYGSIFSALS